MINVIFIGNYLSKSTGTYGVSEKIAHLLSNKSFKIYLSSRKTNRILRILDIAYNCLFKSYDIIQVDTYSGPAFFIAELSTFISKIRKKRIILTLHGGNFPNFYKINKHRINLVFNRSNYLQTPSQVLKLFFKTNNIELNYLPNPIDLVCFPYKRKLVKKNSILWIRAFSDIYNPELAINTLFILKKKYPDATLTMVGPDKGCLGIVNQLIKDLDLSTSINIVGPIDNDKLHMFYQSHKVFINTTSFESFGVSVLEAASCGIPIVSASVGEIPYLWTDNVNILLCNSLEPTCFSSQISKLFESKVLIENLSLNARKKAKTFDWKYIEEKWINMLKESN
jgi:glycosyltransferase involved in cell wall biosynthesis